MLEFIKQRKMIIGIGLAIVICMAIYFLDSTKEYNTIEENQEIMVKNTSEENSKENENDIVVVHVAGAVKKPGIVRLEEGSRIENAINLAGGLTDDADISNINLAYILEDGIKIKIPSIDDKKDDSTGENSYIIEAIGEESVSNKDNKSIVNINTATQTEFQTLSGIGPSLATKIVEYRNKNGKFKKIEDIKNVAGIGDSKYEQIKDYIKV